VDAFCARLLQMQPPARILLLSDAVDSTFAARLGMGWLSATATPRQEIINRVRAALAGQSGELPHGSV
jgi:alkanesulfonate monooxygenase SsuD/methylene tetrahydromethanopterin reductase-like flavin-dependent oxidoreductase (luciferase family)